MILIIKSVQVEQEVKAFLEALVKFSRFASFYKFLVHVYKAVLESLPFVPVLTQYVKRSIRFFFNGRCSSKAIAKTFAAATGKQTHELVSLLSSISLFRFLLFSG